MELNDAAEAIRTCLDLGTREFVVCGGARNAMLVAGLCSLGERVRLWNFPEERSGAFFALGRSKASGRPTAIVTTSGTAAAELLPAAIEAHYSCVPLVLLTADRPERYRGSGAPQSIEQVGLYGPYAETDAAGWNGRAPLHFNVCLEEPTAEAISQIGESLSGVEVGGPPSELAADPRATETVREFIEQGAGLIVMLGELPETLRPPVKDFLSRLGVPVWAEATSGLRAAGFARVSDFSTAERVLRIGGVPSCRAWRDLESNSVAVLSVAPNGLSGLARESSVVRGADWGALLPGVEADVAIGNCVDGGEGNTETKWVRALSEAIPEGSLVFLGNSLPIREWNKHAMFEDRGLRCFANRGANGIDGLVASFLGMAEAEAEAWCVIGDLSALYDLAAAWVLPQLTPGNRRFVVINNGGGKIFRGLGALQGAEEETLAMMENPHGLRFEAWAEMFGMAYRQVTSASELGDLPDGDVVVEIVIED